MTTDHTREALTGLTERERIEYAWHDVTCPEGAECRSRDLHRLSAPETVTLVVRALDLAWVHLKDCRHDAALVEGRDAEIARLRKYAPSPEMEALLERSSLSTTEARAAAESVSPDAGRAVVRMAELMSERDKARARVAAEQEQIATAIEADWTPEWELLREKKLGRGVPMLGRFLADKVRTRIARSSTDGGDTND